MKAFPRRWLVPGCAGGKGSPDRAQTLQCSHKPLSRLGWQHRQKHQDPRAGGASFPTEMCKHSRSYDILFSHTIPQRGINQDVTQEVVWLFSFFLHGNLSQQHYHLLQDISEKEDSGPQRAKATLWLAGLAPGFGRRTLTSLGRGAGSGLIASLRADGGSLSRLWLAGATGPGEGGHWGLGYTEGPTRLPVS